jgi:oxazoline/thiazoline dehydrogenase
LMVKPITCAEVSAAALLDIDCIVQLLGLFLDAGAIAPFGAHGLLEEEASSPLFGWEFHDLLFHLRSRFSRHGEPFGPTYWLRMKAPAPPAATPRRWSHDIRLAELGVNSTVDPPYAEIAGRRRSLRAYSEEALTIEQLGIFLHRAARIQAVSSDNGGEVALSKRPHPSGGGLHELEIYPIVARCDGLQPAMYHYDALGHRLGLVAPMDQNLRMILHMAWLAAGRASQPQVLLAITARFRRVQWKYQTLAYSLILKDVGALYQSMYTSATVMGLAPCALGGGLVDPFCAAAGLDPYEESPVGEFLLGRALES